ncbi:MAG: hypothetical protein R3C56_09400 [Pirellulaceae bacterium]
MRLGKLGVERGVCITLRDDVLEYDDSLLEGEPRALELPQACMQRRDAVIRSRGMQSGISRILVGGGKPLIKPQPASKQLSLLI